MEWLDSGTKLEEELEVFVSPFGHECRRVFALLQSIGENGTRTVKSHRWMTLEDNQRPIVVRDGLEPGRWALLKHYISTPL